MKDYQHELIDIISERTGQKKEIVTAYISAHFEEIENLLTKTSSAKVNGLGVFRIMKTSSENKVLFLPKFDNLEEVAKDIQDATEAETTISTSSLDEDFEITIQTENLSNSNSDNTPITPVMPDLNKIQKSNESSNGNGAEATSDPYKAWDDFYSKKKKTYSWGTTILLIVAVALIGIIIATAL